MIQNWNLYQHFIQPSWAEAHLDKNWCLTKFLFGPDISVLLIKLLTLRLSFPQYSGFQRLMYCTYAVFIAHLKYKKNFQWHVSENQAEIW